MTLKFIQLKYFSFYLIGLYLIVAPFLVFPDMGMYDSKRLIQLLVLGILSLSFVLIYFTSTGSNDKIKISGRALLMVGAFFGIGIISSLYAEFPRYAFIELSMFAALFLLIVLLSSRYRSAHYKLGAFIYTISIAFSVIYLVYFFGNYIASYLNPFVPTWPNRIAVSVRIEDVTYHGKEVLNFVHKRFFNHIQTWTLPLLISAVVLFKSKKVYTYLLLVLAVCWWNLVFASGARGTLFSVGVSCLIIFVLFRKDSYQFLKIAIGSAAGGFLLYLLLFKVFQPAASLPIVRMSDSGRFGFWAIAIQDWASNPILGIGPMQYAIIHDKLHVAHPHNFYLQVLAEWGTIAFAAFAVLIVLFLFFVKKVFFGENAIGQKLNKRNKAVYMGFLGSVAAGFIHAGFSGVFHTPMSQIWAVIIISWLVSLWIRTSGTNTISLYKKHIAICCLVIVSALLFLSSYDLPKLTGKHAEYRKTFDSSAFFPRFWEQGLIYKDSVATKTE